MNNNKVPYYQKYWYIPHIISVLALIVAIINAVMQ